MSKSKFSDLDEELETLGYGNQWEAQIETLAVRELEKRHSDIERLNEYNRRNPEKHKEAIKRATAKRQERAQQLIDLAKRMYGPLPCHGCKKKLSATDLLKGQCQKCNAKTKENDDAGYDY